ncbi:MAG: hypothetical protein KAR36_03050 [Candidatus Latescibacteria bacterium]|nr:hypothetical protein [Candidatus Latescibacterota bacterium]MCK5327556.1 hypothetical protein [Candidatus Latescibacterota bacterium]
MEGYGTESGRLEALDVIRHRMSWEGRTTVRSAADGLCRLRFTLYQGSLFSYRWSKVGG